MKTTPPITDDRAKKDFRRPGFQLMWVFATIAVFIFPGLPVQRLLLVCWVKGVDAYFHHHLRVLPGKPPYFSDGTPVPGLTHFVTGAVVFLAIGIGLALLMHRMLRLYDRYIWKKYSVTPL